MESENFEEEKQKKTSMSSESVSAVNAESEQDLSETNQAIDSEEKPTSMSSESGTLSAVSSKSEQDFIGRNSGDTESLNEISETNQVIDSDADSSSILMETHGSSFDMSLTNIAMFQLKLNRIGKTTTSRPTIRFAFSKAMLKKALQSPRYQEKFSLQHLRKFISENYILSGSNVERWLGYIKQYLNEGLNNGNILRVSGKGFVSSFRLSAKGARSLAMRRQNKKKTYKSVKSEDSEE